MNQTPYGKIPENGFIRQKQLMPCLPFLLRRFGDVSLLENSLNQ